MARASRGFDVRLGFGRHYRQNRSGWYPFSCRIVQAGSLITNCIIVENLDALTVGVRSIPRNDFEVRNFLDCSDPLTFSAWIAFGGNDIADFDNGSSSPQTARANKTAPVEQHRSRGDGESRSASGSMVALCPLCIQPRRERRGCLLWILRMEVPRWLDTRHEGFEGDDTHAHRRFPQTLSAF